MENSNEDLVVKPLPSLTSEIIHKIIFEMEMHKAHVRDLTTVFSMELMLLIEKVGKTDINGAENLALDILTHVDLRRGSVLPFRTSDVLVQDDILKMCRLLEDISYESKTISSMLVASVRRELDDLRERASCGEESVIEDKPASDIRSVISDIQKSHYRSDYFDQAPKEDHLSESYDNEPHTESRSFMVPLLGALCVIALIGSMFILEMREINGSE